MLYNLKNLLLFSFIISIVYACAGTNKLIKPDWIDVVYKTALDAYINGDIINNEVIITSSGVGGFKLDFTDKVLGNITEPFSVRINNNINYYGKIPASKKLYFLYNVISQTNIEIIKYRKVKIDNVRTDLNNIIENSIVTNNEITSKLEPKPFIPKHGKVKIKFENINDGAKELELNIFSPESRLFKRIRKNDNVKNEIVWDGKGDNGKYLPNGLDCYYQLKYKNRNNEIIVSKKFKLSTGLFVKKEKDKKLSINFSDILFKKNSYYLTKSAKLVLNKVIKFLERYSTDKLKKIIIEGYTDNTGSEKYNSRLSEKRAGEVLKYITGQGSVDNKKFSAIGYGSANPIYPNTTDENRKKNRRVRIIIDLGKK